MARQRTRAGPVRRAPPAGRRVEPQADARAVRAGRGQALSRPDILALQRAGGNQAVRRALVEGKVEDRVQRGLFDWAAGKAISAEGVMALVDKVINDKPDDLLNRVGGVVDAHKGKVFDMVGTKLQGSDLQLGLSGGGAVLDMGEGGAELDLGGGEVGVTLKDEGNTVATKIGNVALS